jgi:FkbM family methyltransferase
LIKFFLKNLLKTFSLYISRIDWQEKHSRLYKIYKNDLSFDNIYKKFFNNKKKIIIFDVGANVGQSIDRYKKIFSNFEIHCFEPNQDAFDILFEKKNKNIYLNQVAVGDKIGYESFYNYSKTSSSSFSKINKSSILNKQNKKYYQSKVRVITLDYYIKTNKIKNIDILKIDTQSHEDKVLLGAQGSLKKKLINFIETEVMLGQQYEKVNSFYKIEKNFSQNDYSLLAINNTGNLLTNKDFQLDVIYIKNSFFKKFK